MTAVTAGVEVAGGSSKRGPRREGTERVEVGVVIEEGDARGVAAVSLVVTVVPAIAE